MDDDGSYTGNPKFYPSLNEIGVIHSVKTITDWQECAEKGNEDAWCSKVQDP